MVSTLVVTLVATASWCSNRGNVTPAQLNFAVSDKILVDVELLAANRFGEDISQLFLAWDMIASTLPDLTYSLTCVLLFHSRPVFYGHVYITAIIYPTKVLCQLNRKATFLGKVSQSRDGACSLTRGI